MVKLPFILKTKPKLLRLYAILIIFAAIGTSLLIYSHAQTPYASVNAASGSLSGATKVADSSASNGYKVVFSSGSSGAQTTNCFSSPGACGYPDPAYGNVGLSPAQCAALPTFQLSDLPSNDYYYSGSGDVIEIDANNVTVKGYNIVGWVFLQSSKSGLTIDNDCITVNGDSGSVTPVINASGGQGQPYGSHLTVENSTIRASDCTVAQAATAICNNASALSSDIGGGDYTTVKNNILVGGIENVNGLGTGSVTEDNYIVADGNEAGAHTEDIYGSIDTINTIINHNTLLNPYDETAEIFLDNGSGTCQNNGISITNNLMAGGGYTIYACSGANSLGSNTLTFTGNDIARCAGTTTYDPSAGGDQCGSKPPGSPAQAYGAGADSHGYWPHGGFFGTYLNIFCSAPGTTWSGNHWDDNSSAIVCQ